MRTLRSITTFTLLSEYTAKPLLNLLQDGEEEDQTPPPTKEEEPDPEAPESQEEELDEPEPETPAGKKFSAMRKAKKEAEASAQKEREARLIAEAKAQAFEEAMARIDQGKKPEKKDVTTNPEDDEYVDAILRKKGYDPEENKKLRQELQQIKFGQDLEIAITNLSSKYKDSVPFNRAKVIQYVQENKLLAHLNAPLERVLDIAHKEMNEDALADWRYKQRKKGQKDAPEILDKGTGKKEVRTDKPSTAAEYRKLAFEITGAE